MIIADAQDFHKNTFECKGLKGPAVCIDTGYAGFVAISVADWGDYIVIMSYFPQKIFAFLPNLFCLAKGRYGLLRSSPP